MKREIESKILKMRKIGILISLALIIFAFKSDNLNLEKKENSAYKRGEKLKYAVYYTSAITGNVSAGEMTSEIKYDSLKFSERSTYHIELIGKSAGAFNWFMKVRDVFESWVDEEALVPWYFRNRIHEGDYKASKDIAFLHASKKAKYTNNKNSSSKLVDIPTNTQDLLSAIYYARTIDYTNAKVGSKYEINFIFDDSVYKTQLEYYGLFNITTKLGRIECMKFKPRVLSGGVFKDETPLSVYVTNDKNRLPVFAESEIIIGAVRMELIQYSGLRNAFTSLKAKKK